MGPVVHFIPVDVLSQHSPQWDSSDILSLVALVLAPLSALVTLWLTMRSQDKMRRLEHIEKRTREEEAAKEARLHLYGAFLGALVTYATQLEERRRVRASILAGEPDNGRFAEVERLLYRAHERKMEPLFRIRLLGSEALVAAAVEADHWSYRLRDAVDDDNYDSEEWDRSWVVVRDAFIQAVQVDVGFRQEDIAQGRSVYDRG